MTKQERDDLIVAHWGLARFIASRYKWYGVYRSFDDLAQEGVIGLIEAVNAMERRQLVLNNFNAWARWRVRRAIWRALYPGGKKPKFRPEEILLSKPSPDGKLTLGDMLEGERRVDARLDAAEERQDLRRAIALLPAKERRVIRAFFFEGLSLEEIAEQEDSTRNSIDFVKSSGLERLRRLLRRYGYYPRLLRPCATPGCQGMRRRQGLCDSCNWELSKQRRDA